MTHSNKWRIGTFFTVDTPYQQVYYDYLEKSCKKFNIQPWFMITENYHSWYRNVAEKPKAILNMLNENEKDVCLVFLDADATIEQHPTLFDEIPEEYDIAYHTLNWNEWYGYKAQRPVMELLTGTMFFRNNNKVKKLCQEWYEKAIETNTWEQKVLQKIIKNHNLKIYDLPLEYCYMKSRPRNQEPLVKLDPIILHHQVSRELKRKLL